MKSLHSCGVCGRLAPDLSGAPGSVRLLRGKGTGCWAEEPTPLLRKR